MQHINQYKTIRKLIKSVIKKKTLTVKQNLILLVQQLHKFIADSVLKEKQHIIIIILLCFVQCKNAVYYKLALIDYKLALIELALIV